MDSTCQGLHQGVWGFLTRTSLSPSGATAKMEQRSLQHIQTDTKAVRSPSRPPGEKEICGWTLPYSHSCATRRVRSLEARVGRLHDSWRWRLCPFKHHYSISWTDSFEVGLTSFFASRKNKSTKSNNKIMSPSLGTASKI